MHHLVEWNDNILMIGWFGGKLEESGFWDGFGVSFEGFDEDYYRRYPEKPEAAIALSHIVNWQNQG